MPEQLRSPFPEFKIAKRLRLTGAWGHVTCCDQSSVNPLIRALFEGVKVERGKMAKGSLISSQFLGQLSKLMTLIGSTEAHFIR